MGRPALLIPKGTLFGRLTVRKQVPHTTRGIEYECICECGNPKVVKAYNLRNGTIASCGCAKFDKPDIYRQYPKEVAVLYGAIRRCHDPKAQAYHWYGARGITVCKRWRSKYGFENFLEDMGPRPSPKHQLDRKNNDRGYSPGNCRWVTSLVNNNNRRNTPMVTYKGRTQSIKEWARETGINAATFGDRLKRGWSMKRALNPKLVIGRSR
jgi:hypothetical protein